MSISLDQIIAFLMGPFGTLFLTLFILYAGHKKWWAFGWYAEELRKRNDRLENRLDNITHENKAVASVAEKAVTAAEQKAEVTNG